MTYHLTHRPRRVAARYARPRQAMGGIFDVVDDLINVSMGLKPGTFQSLRQGNCANSADESVAGMGVSIDAFEQSWNPTGFYTPDEMQKVILAVLDYASGARDQITAALSNVDIDDSDHKADAPVFNSAYNEFDDQSKKVALFVAAKNDAQTKGISAINAPGLKLWVISLMRASQNLARAAFFLNCNKSSFERVSAFLNNIVDKAISIIKTVAGIVLKAGELAVDVVGDFGSLLAKVIKFAPYVLLLGGGLYLYKQYRDR